MFKWAPLGFRTNPNHGVPGFYKLHTFLMMLIQMSICTWMTTCCDLSWKFGDVSDDLRKAFIEIPMVGVMRRCHPLRWTRWHVKPFWSDKSESHSIFQNSCVIHYSNNINNDVPNFCKLQLLITLIQVSIYTWMATRCNHNWYYKNVSGDLRKAFKSVLNGGRCASISSSPVNSILTRCINHKTL